MRTLTGFLRRALLGIASKFPRGVRLRLADEMLRLRHGLQESERRDRSRRAPAIVPVIESVDGRSLKRSILERRNPWALEEPPRFETPRMLTDEECRYYWYLSRFYSGCGECVELGPWIGYSTRLLVEALRRNSRFSGRRLRVFDDFVWRSEWMTPAIEDSGLAAPSNHGSFRHLFEAQISGLEGLVEVNEGKLSDFDGNEALAPIRWTGEPIELLVVDCGRSLAVNEAWWRAFSGSFLPDRTLIVMQDWQCFKAVPERHWENTKIFTDSKAGALDLIHELVEGATGTFVYRGTQFDEG